VIAVVSSAPRERRALCALCEGQQWNTSECDSIRAATRLTRRVTPRAMVIRHRLEDGFSDDILSALRSDGLLGQTRIIVLLAPGTPSATEVRQVTIGADYVMRDPIRSDVLLAYLEKFISAAPAGTTPARQSKLVVFAGARLNLLDRTLEHRKRTVTLTPREVELLEILATSGDSVLTYESLYSRILGRTFRGDTSNMRVLLGKLNASAGRVGISVRDSVEVIAKTGYRCRASSPAAARSGAR
jgi:DNA-binding response OmpR family regulator